MPPPNPNPAAGLTLTNTTIVPPENPASVLADNTAIKMVVLGNRPAVVQLADDATLAPPVAVRKVIWFVPGLPANYATLFTVPAIYQPQFNNPATIQAFSLSLDNIVKNVILNTEAVDEVRIEICYTAAGQ